MANLDNVPNEITEQFVKIEPPMSLRAAIAAAEQADCYLVFVGDLDNDNVFITGFHGRDAMNQIKYELLSNDRKGRGIFHAPKSVIDEALGNKQ